MNDKQTVIKEANQYIYEIKALFEYDVSCDNLDIHPMGICSLCRRKTDRCKKALWNGDQNSTMQKKIIFQERSDISLLSDKKFAVRPFTVTVTH